MNMVGVMMRVYNRINNSNVVFQALLSEIGEVSTRMVWPFCLTKIDERSLLFLESFDRQTLQVQQGEGTPVEVPVPRNKISIIVQVYKKQ